MSFFSKRSGEEFPSEDQIPVHSSAEIGTGWDVVEIVHIDDIDDWSNDSFWVLEVELQRAEGKNIPREFC